MARIEINEPHRLLAASIGLAKPKNNKLHGYISEHHTFGEVQQKAGDYAEELAAEMLAETLDIDFDPNKDWHEKEQVFKASKQIIYTRNHTQTVIGDKDGKWTTAIAAAVFVI
jgi:arginine decarboxylase